MSHRAWKIMMMMAGSWDFFFLFALLCFALLSSFSNFVIVIR